MDPSFLLTDFYQSQWRMSGFVPELVYLGNKSEGWLSFFRVCSCLWWSLCGASSGCPLLLALTLVLLSGLIFFFSLLSSNSLLAPATSPPSWLAASTSPPLLLGRPRRIDFLLRVSGRRRAATSIHLWSKHFFFFLFFRILREQDGG